MPTPSPEADLVLASASPRRLDLLRLAGLDPVVAPADVDETVRDGEAPEVYVVRLARAKAEAASGRPGIVVLGADTTVVLDGHILGKPEDERDAVAMLRRLAGRTHTVSTGVVALGAGDRREIVVSTAVTFAPLDDAAIRRYVATGEPLDKAGGYGIQGRAAAFVERIDGSYTNVVGLPLAQTLTVLRAAGLRGA
ncbi:MAG TPA: Maf family protein [Egibacteraceae bacterium]|nr:Maf family protein [Egibacteraceae bacterium]